MKIALIGTYPPRECGIGTFSNNLLDAILQTRQAEKHRFEGFVVAVDDNNLTYDYPKEVKLTIRQEVQVDYLKAARYINLSGADICILQHEFGIFGGQNGVYILPLLHRLEKPLVVTLHTILKSPTYNEKAVLQEIAKMAQRIVVMSHKAVEFLTQIWEEVTVARSVELENVNPWVNPFEVTVCRKPKIDMEAVWPQVRPW
jgi:hypothetical protein